MQLRFRLDRLGLSVAIYLAAPAALAFGQAYEGAPPSAPPPANAYPPGYGPAYGPAYNTTATVAPTEPGFRRGFLALPYMGAHIPLGSTSDSLDTGFRTGVILGGHVSPILSLNGEMTIDVLNLKGVPSGVDVTAVIVDLLFSPLLHFGTDSIEVFGGPKIGAFGMSESVSAQGQSASASARGLAYGFNLGLAVPVGNIAIGGLFSYTGRHATEACQTAVGGSEHCGDASGDDFKALSFAAAVIF